MDVINAFLSFSAPLRKPLSEFHLLKIFRFFGSGKITKNNEKIFLYFAIKTKTKNSQREMLFASSTALLFALYGVVLAHQSFTITTAQDLIDFSNEVNSGTSYLGTTVYLGSDIDFTSSLSQKFRPIGFTESNFFNGTFDGQGYIIRNLTITTPSSFYYTGLFGYSGGATIRNLVMDASCSVNSTTFSTRSTNSHVHTGGIIGSCRTVDSDCLIENSVNMGGVSFGGNVGCYNLRIGGIVGELGYSSVDSMAIRNCVNYGDIYKTGTSGFAWIGGIVGIASENNYYKYIQNCANYGSITHSGSTTNRLGLGGVVGYTSYAKVENCLSSGKVSSTKNTSNSYQGAVVGDIPSETYINYCHLTNDAGLDNLHGTGTPSSIVGSSSSPVSLDSTLLDNLNDQASKNSEWSKWFMLHLNGGRINNLTQETLIATQKHFPDPVKEGNTFLYWCKNEECAEIYNPKTANISEVTGLHAHYQIQRYTVTFIFNNGTENEVRTLNFNEVIVYPENPTKPGYTFNGWSPKPDRMPAENITVTANWTESTLESGSSQKSDIYSQSRSLSENADSTQSWSSSKPRSSSEDDVSSVRKKLPESSSTSVISTEFVEIIFEKKDLKKEDVENFIKKYVNEANFTIFEIGNDEAEGTRVIIKFVDVETAQNFIEQVRTSSDIKVIKKVDFISEPINSFSESFYFSFLTFIFVV